MPVPPKVVLEKFEVRGEIEMKTVRVANRVMPVHCNIVIAIALMLLLSSQSPPLRRMEFLGRGVVALRVGEEEVFVSWRVLATDPDDIAFNLYRKTGN